MTFLKQFSYMADIYLQSMKKFFSILLMSLFVISPASFAQEEPLPPLPKGPMILTSATPAMQSADYWIRKLPNPDKVLKTPEQLEKFNDEIRLMIPDQLDTLKWTPPRGSQIRKLLETEYETVSNRKLFGVDDKYIKKSYFDENIKPNIQFDKVPDKISLKWGAAVRATSVRALPTTVKMLEEKGDVEFDMLQFTLIKVWIPVAILHTTADGKWYYMQTDFVRGWVESKDIAIFDNREALREKVKSKSFISVTGESVSIYRDPEFQMRVQKLSMGTVLPLSEKTDTAFVVWMPYRGEGGKVALKKHYIKRGADVSVGFPAFTQRNILNQAFKLLGQRYGWGGQYHGRDCSGFTFDVFRSMGMALPRDSHQQVQVGTQLGHFEPFERLETKAQRVRERAVPAITLFKMPKHMMLYLGEENGHIYIIHSTWAERIGSDPIKDEKRRINQVVVTDMSLNGNSYLGSLFDRTIGINKFD